MKNISYITQKLYLKDDFEFSPTIKNPGGGVVTKVAYLQECIPDIHVTSDMESMGRVALIEPLRLQTPTWEENKAILEKNKKTVKILWAEEQTIIRWSDLMREDVMNIFDGIAVSNEYLKQIAEAVFPDFPIWILYTPINEDVYKPTKKKKQVVAIGKLGLQKNISALLELFGGLSSDIDSVYIGNPGMWGNIQYSHDTELQDRMKVTCTKYHESLPPSDVAEIMSESSVYVNFSIYDVGCLSFLEAAMSGCHSYCWDYHPMFDEYKNVQRPIDVKSAIDLVNGYFDVGKPSANNALRKEIIGKHGFESFKKQLGDILQEVFIHGTKDSRNNESS